MPVINGLKSTKLKTMKKLKTSMLAIALIAGISGAFVAKIHASPKKTDATYHWLKYLSDGVTRDPGNDSDVSISTAETNYGCTGAGNRCADGTKDPGSGTGPTTFELKYN